jgi:nitrogen fixation/metabolism regulation signal transduction histidine kinase
MNTLAPTPVPAVDARDKRKRSVRNYLLDARFQLKFTVYIVGVTIIVAGLLGIFLWRTTQTLFAETEVAVEARSRAAETSKALSVATLNNQLMEKFNDPKFAAELAAKSKEIDEQYESEHRAILAQKQDLERRQKVTFAALLGGMLGFVVFIGLATIVTTHKIVGPLYRMKRMAQEVAAGKWHLPTIGLRPGDELKDMFEEFTRMIQSLRDGQTEEIQQLISAIERAERAGAPKEAISELRALEVAMRRRLG